MDLFSFSSSAEDAMELKAFSQAPSWPGMAVWPVLANEMSSAKTFNSSVEIFYYSSVSSVFATAHGSMFIVL